MSYYRDTKKGFGIVAVCFLLVAVLLCGMMTSWFKDWNPYCWFGHDYDEDGICQKCGEEKPVEEEDDKEDNALAFAGVSGQGIGLRRIRSVANTSNINGKAVETQTIEAVVQGDTDNLSVTWSIAWANAASAWANGKDVNDYVKLSSTTANPIDISCEQAFGEQVILTCTANFDPSVKATATIDYEKRILGVEFTCDAINMLSSTYVDMATSDMLTTFNASLKYSDGTVACASATTVKVTSVTLELSDALHNAIGDSNNAASYLSKANAYCGVADYNRSITLTENGSSTASWGTMSPKVKFDDFFKMTSGEKVYCKAAQNYIKNTVAANDRYMIVSAVVTVTIDGVATTHNISMNVPIATSYLESYTFPNSITLDPGSIKF